MVFSMFSIFLIIIIIYSYCYYLLLFFMYLCKNFADMSSSQQYFFLPGAHLRGIPGEKHIVVSVRLTFSIF